MKVLPLAFTSLAALLLAGVTPSTGVAATGLADLERAHVALGDHALITFPGDVRFVYGNVDPIAITTTDPNDPAATAEDQLLYLKLRLTPAAVLFGRDWPFFKAYQLLFDVDTRVYPGTSTPGYLAYDPERQVRQDWAGPRLVQGYLLAAGPDLVVKLGLTRSDWGEGILANGGAEPTAGAARSPFGRSRFVDRVLRAQVAWMPLKPVEGAAPLTLAIAGDAVIEDANADWEQGDRTYNAIAAVSAKVERFSGGVYGVYRNEEHAEGGETEVGVVDLLARFDLIREESLKLWVEGEGAVIFGQTTLSQSVFFDEPTKVLSWGAMGRAVLRTDVLEAAFEVGSASGDDDAFDDRQTSFSFNREYGVGLLMFREVLKTSTAITPYNLADETYREYPPRGYDALATSGAVRGATYINPRLALFPTDGLCVMLAYLYGFATADSEGGYVDPFQSSLIGGEPAGPRGARSETGLGHEVDVAVEYQHPFEHFSPMVRLEGGWFRPGPVFDDAEGRAADDVVGVWVHTGGTF